LWPNFKVLSQHSFGGTEKNHENLNYDSRGRHLNPEPNECEEGVYEVRIIVISKERIWMISVHFPESGDLVQRREQWRHKSEGTG
jgi:hypothetical protein